MKWEVNATATLRTGKGWVQSKAEIVDLDLPKALVIALEGVLEEASILVNNRTPKAAVTLGTVELTIRANPSSQLAFSRVLHPLQQVAAPMTPSREAGTPDCSVCLKRDLTRKEGP